MRVVAVAVALADLAVLPVDEVLGSLTPGGVTARGLRFGLGSKGLADSGRARSPVRPSVSVRHRVYRFVGGLLTCHTPSFG